MHLLVDLDDTVANLSLHFAEMWQNRHPNDRFVKSEDRTTFYLTEEYGVDLAEKVLEILRSPGFFRDLPFIPNGDRVISDLADKGHVIQFCTAPVTGSSACLQEKYDWVVEYFGQILADTMVISADKTLVRGDILIDDRPEQPGRYVPTWEHVIFDAAYNRAVVGKRRLANWLQAYQLFVEEVVETETMQLIL